MEIINAHVHMIEIEMMLRKSGDLKIPGGIAVLQDMEATLPLLSPQTLIQQMDEAGIAKSVLYAVEAPIVYSSNEYVYKLCQEFPDRLIGFASVNPHDPNAPQILERAVCDYHFRGLKLHPPLQNFFPNDERVFPVYEKATALNIPVVFHVGTTPFGHLCRLSQASPLLLDDVAVQFPKLRIMLTHLGTLAHQEAFMVVEKNPNVYIDTSAYLYEIPQILTRDLIKRLGSHKLIFGTDYPMPYSGQVHRMKDFVDCMHRLDLPGEILQKVFKDNFEALCQGSSVPSAQDDISLVEIVSRMNQKTNGG